MADQNFPQERYGIWDLGGLTDRERELTVEALEAADFDWYLLMGGLQAQTGRATIPVEWADLTRYAKDAEANVSHLHDVGDEAHVLAGDFQGRRAALGLAWYSGKISVEATLVDEPDIAREVFLAEAAHMVDFFYLSDAQRVAIYLAYHSDMAADEVERHGHDWFDKGEYWSWVGESFMVGFTTAFASSLPRPLAARQPWEHATTPGVAAQIRRIIVATDEPAGSTRVFADKDGSVYHDSHRHPFIEADEWWDTPADAQRAGRRACRVCKPA